MNILTTENSFVIQSWLDSTIFRFIAVLKNFTLPASSLQFCNSAEFGFSQNTCGVS